MSWPLVKLGEIAPSKPIRANRYNADDLVWQITLDHVEANTGVLLEKCIRPYSEAGSSTHGFDDRYVLYSKLRPYLNKVLLPDDEGVCTTELVPMLPNQETLDRNYLAHYLKSKEFVNWISAQTAGAKMPRVSMDVFWDHEIPLPPLEEQKRIAAILDKADSIRRKRQQAIKLADDFLRSVFLEMFGDPVTNPKGWELRSLGSLIVSGPTNGLYKPSTDYGDGTRILRIDGFYNGFLSSQSKLKRLRIDATELERFRLNERSIVINRVNSREYLGKSAYIVGLEEPTVFESNMMNFSVDENQLNPRYLVELLQTTFIKNQILTSAKDAVNQSSINQQDVKKLEILIPPIELQLKFEDVAERKKYTSFAVDTSLTESNKLFLSLSQKAFSGTL